MAKRTKATAAYVATADNPIPSTPPPPADRALERGDLEGAIAGAITDAGAAEPTPLERAIEAATPPVPMRDMMLSPDDLAPSPLNPRRVPPSEQADQDLEDSIVALGILQAIVARPLVDNPHYEIICGERRWRLTKRAQDKGRLPADYLLPVRIREATDRELIVLAGTENLERDNMHPLDEAALYEALRPHTERGKRGGGPERAIARELHVSPRTVFRRLALLRLIPEIQEALKTARITLGQAAAFALGSPPDQKKYWRDTFGSDVDEDDIDQENLDFAREPRRIRDAMTEELIPLRLAAFTAEAYRDAGGAILEDPESNEQYCADAKLFRTLQDRAAQAKVAEIMATKKWPWVELLSKKLKSWNYADASSKKDREAGVLVYLDDVNDGFTIRVREGVLRPATVDRRKREAEESASRDKAGRKGGARAAAEAADDDHERSNRAASSAPATPRYYLTDPQSIALHQAKTRAMRRGTAEQPTIAVALAVLAMLCHGSEINLHGSGWQQSRAENMPPLPAADRKRLGDLVAPLATLPKRWHDASPWPSKTQAAVFGELIALPWDDLISLFAALIAERVGTWFGPDPRYGDGPLAIAIAAAVNARHHLVDLWAPDEAYFSGYTKETLTAIAERAAAAGAPIAEGMAHMKKGELVKYLGTLPAATWRPELFVETAWMGDSAQKKAFAKGETAPAVLSATEAAEGTAAEQPGDDDAGDAGEATPGQDEPDGIEELLGSAHPVTADRGGMP